MVPSDATPEHIEELNVAFEQHQVKAQKQIDMLKKAQLDGPTAVDGPTGWRTIVTGKYDFSFFCV